jgi:hypothetical protein
MLNPRCLVPMLLMILLVQLTGLTCIGELAGGLWRDSMAFCQQESFLPVPNDVPHGDGCPCHLAFLCNLCRLADASHPDEPLSASLAPSTALQYTAIPFHPPLIA